MWKVNRAGDGRAQSGSVQAAACPVGRCTRGLPANPALGEASRAPRPNFKKACKAAQGVGPFPVLGRRPAGLTLGLEDAQHPFLSQGSVSPSVRGRAPPGPLGTFRA